MYNDGLLTYVFEINNEGKPVPKEIRQPNYIEGVYNAAFINDSLYVRDDFMMSPTLQLLTFNDELPRKSWRYGNPAILDRFIDPDWGHLYANDSRIVFCYHWKKQIDFMDTNLNLLERVRFKYSSTDPITEKNQFDVKECYGSGYLGKRYLYALYRGASWNEFKKMSYRGSEIEVYDLDGEPVIKYRFDGIAPRFFVVDEETFTLYGVGADGEPIDNLLVYKLKGLY